MSPCPFPTKITFTPRAPPISRSLSLGVITYCKKWPGCHRAQSMFYPISSPRETCDTRSIFSSVKLVWIQSFPSSRLVNIPRLESCLLYYLGNSKTESKSRNLVIYTVGDNRIPPPLLPTSASGGWYLPATVIPSWIKRILLPWRSGKEVVLCQFVFPSTAGIFDDPESFTYNATDILSSTSIPNRSYFCHSYQRNKKKSLAYKRFKLWLGKWDKDMKSEHKLSFFRNNLDLWIC